MTFPKIIFLACSLMLLAVNLSMAIAASAGEWDISTMSLHVPGIFIPCEIKAPGTYGNCLEWAPVEKWQFSSEAKRKLMEKWKKEEMLKRKVRESKP